MPLSETLKCLFLIVYAGICAYTDLRYRSIDLRFSLAVALAGFILWIFNEDVNFSNFLRLLFGLFPGMILIFISYLSKGAIGKGDAIFIIVLGFYFSARGVIFLLTLTWMISGVFAVIIVAASKISQRNLSKRGLPFTSLAFPVIVIDLLSRYL